MEAGSQDSTVPGSAQVGIANSTATPEYYGVHALLPSVRAPPVMLAAGGDSCLFFFLFCFFCSISSCVDLKSSISVLYAACSNAWSSKYPRITCPACRRCVANHASAAGLTAADLRPVWADCGQSWAGRTWDSSRFRSLADKFVAGSDGRPCFFSNESMRPLRAFECCSMLACLCCSSLSTAA